VLIKRLKNALFKHHRIGVGYCAYEKIEPLVNVVVAVEGLCSRVHFVATLITEIESRAHFAILLEYARKIVLELLADDIALGAKCFIFFEPTETDSIVELFKLRLNICHKTILSPVCGWEAQQESMVLDDIMVKCQRVSQHACISPGRWLLSRFILHQLTPERPRQHRPLNVGDALVHRRHRLLDDVGLC
jgi:hypothetical protein